MSGMRGTLPAMAFSFIQVEYPGQGNFGKDGDWFEFGPGGILAVHYADPNKDHKYFAPGAWRELRTDQPPGPPTVEKRDWGFSI